MKKNAILTSGNQNKNRSDKYSILEKNIDCKLKTVLPNFSDRFYNLPERVITLFHNTISKKTWFNCLLMYAIILNEEGTPISVYPRINATNSLFCWANDNGIPVNMNIDIKKILLELNKKGKNITWYFSSYNSLLIHGERFFTNYPQEVKLSLSEYILPEFSTGIEELKSIRNHENRKSITKKQKNTAPLKKNITNLVSLARRRWDWIFEVYKKIMEIKSKIKSCEIELPYKLSIKKIDGTGELNFVVWNKVQWINHHKNLYKPDVINHWTAEEGVNSTNIFFQFIGEIPSNSWFLRAIKSNFLQVNGDFDGIETKEYSKEQNIPTTAFRSGINSGVLLSELKSAGFISRARLLIRNETNESSILFQFEPLINSAIIGYLGVLIISLTGMRISEIQQLNLEDSIKLITLPRYDEENEIWEDDSTYAYIFEIITKGKKEFQKSYAPQIIIDSLQSYMKFYKEIHGEKLYPIFCNSNENSFRLARHYLGQKKTWIFQWKGTHLSDKTIRGCIYFILLEQNLIDEDGNPIRLSAHSFRHGFAGYLKQKGVPLERIAELLHHVNVLVTDYYSREPSEVILEQIYTILDDIGGELRIDTGCIRSIDDIRRFEEECLKKFGALRKVIGGKCGVYCSCEAINMCARCDNFIPERERRFEIVERIDSEEKVADYYEKMGQHISAERIRCAVQDWKISLAELDSWNKVIEIGQFGQNQGFLCDKTNIDSGLLINPKSIPSTPPQNSI